MLPGKELTSIAEIFSHLCKLGTQGTNKTFEGNVSQKKMKN